MSFSEEKRVFYIGSMADFDNEIHRLRGLMSGEGITLWQYMSTPEGEYSEERTWAIIEEILECKRLYGGPPGYCNEEGEWVDEEEDEDTTEAMKKLFYCILRVVTCKGLVFRTLEGADYLLEDVAIPAEKVTFGILLTTLRLLDDCYKEPNPVMIIAQRGTSYVRERHMIDLLAEFYEVLSGGKKIKKDSIYSKLKSNKTLDREARGIDSMFAYDNPGDKGCDVWDIEGEPATSFPYKEEYCKCLEDVAAYFGEKGFSVSEMYDQFGLGIEDFLEYSTDTIFGDMDKYYEILVHIRKALRIARRYTKN